MATATTQTPDELAAVIEEVDDLTPLQKHFLRARWLSNVNWFDRHASGCRILHFSLRSTTVIGGVLVPGLIGWKGHESITNVLAAVISLAVAASASIEQLFRFGERWRHYRRSAELLKIEGWRFLQLTKPYQKLTHADAFSLFAARVEDLCQSEIETYMSEVARDEDKPKGAGAAAGAS